MSAREALLEAATQTKHADVSIRPPVKALLPAPSATAAWVPTEAQRVQSEVLALAKTPVTPPFVPDWNTLDVEPQSVQFSVVAVLPSRVEVLPAPLELTTAVAFEPQPTQF